MKQGRIDEQEVKNQSEPSYTNEQIDKQNLLNVKEVEWDVWTSLEVG